MKIWPWLVVALAASPACAFDCGKARTASEKAICADPAARAADEAMAQAFAKLIAETSPSAKPTLLAAQARWLQERDGACADAKAPGACLAEESARRRAFLAGEPEAGPGAPGRLAPVFRHDKGAKGRAAITLQLLKFPAPANPGEKSFNAAVDRLVGPMDQPETDDPAADRYEYVRTMRLVFASPALISAHLDAYSDSGGAHPGTFSGNINLDVGRGTELKFAELFDAKAAKTLFALCQKQVVAQKKEREGAEAPLGPEDLKELAKNIAEETGKLETWSFAADKARVSYDPYAVGAYAEGAFSCEISYATLKPLAKPGSPLP